MAFKGYKRTVKLEFDYNQIKEGIPNVKRQMAVLNAEFRKSNEEAKASGKEIDNLGVRYDYLSNKLKIQQKEVDSYREKLEKARNAQGNNTRAVQNATASLEIAEARLGQTKIELEKVTKEMEYQQGIIDKSSEEWKDLEYQLELIGAEYSKASAEAKKSGDIVNELSAEHKNLSDVLKIQERQVEMLKEKLNEATSAENKNEQAIRENTLELVKAEAQLEQTKVELDRVTQELEKQKLTLGKTADEWTELSEKTTSIGKSMSMKLTAPILAAGAASFKLGADFEQAMGKMEVVFEDNSKAIEKWATNSLKDFGLARTTAITMVSDFGALFKGMGINLKQTEEWSKTLTERTMDLANFYDTSVEETINALNAIVTGQTEPLRKFGINMTQATLQEYAFSRGIRKKISDMTEAEKVQLRYNFVIERTNIAVGTTARESDSATGQLNMFKQSVIELGVSFSEQILPVVTPFIEKLNAMIQGFANLSDGTKKFIVTVLGIVAAVGPVLIVLGSVFKAISNIAQGIGAIPNILKGVGEAGGALSGALNNTAFFGFAKWALIIAAVAAAIGFLIKQINVLIGRGREAQASLGAEIQSMTGQMNKVMSGAAIRGYAVGTRYHPGGRALVGEEGPEIIDLPQGSQVYTAAETRRMLNSSGGDTYILQVNMNEVDEVYKLTRVFNEFKQTKKAGVLRYG